MREIVETKEAPNPIGPYSQAVRANGFVFVSGQIPVLPKEGSVVGGGIEAQTHQVMKNLAAILKASGSGLDQVVKTTVYLSDLDDFSEFNRIYGEYFGDVKPARATVQAARLPREVLVEIEAGITPVKAANDTNQRLPSQCFVLSSFRLQAAGFKLLAQ
jgi:2-iminobutanoate/2-iminopropanoate deaminase